MITVVSYCRGHSRNLRQLSPGASGGFRHQWTRQLMKLTKRAVDAVTPPENGETFFWDDDLRGFGLRVYASGRRIFVVQYRLRGGRGSRTRRIVLGEYGKITPDEARK